MSNSQKRGLRWLWLPTFFLLLALFLFGYWRPYEKITHLTIDSGNVPTERMEADLGLHQGDYRWRAFGQTAFLAKRLKDKNDHLSQVTVRLRGKTLEVQAAEKVNTGFIQKKGQWYQLDSAGNQSRVDQPAGQGPVYSNFTSQSRIRAVARAVNVMDRAIRGDIGEIRFAPNKTNPDRLILTMNDGHTVYASQATLASKMAYYSTIVAQLNQPGVVDLQFGSYAYPYGAEKAS
ncbi:cell division protein FtsQ/DivIB [Leuconostocaceae bacterium ESL0958]|nr:cell division protein FtsQ/DivIB [Leuconostocaceae bacterium ESL0958]